MNNGFLETALLTTGVVVSVLFLGAFLLLQHVSQHVERQANGKMPMDGMRPSAGTSFLQKVSDWYLTREAVPFWIAFAVDCLIIIYSHLMAVYLLFGVQALVPYFWPYVLFSIYTLPCYYVGMKLLRSYETIMRFSTMEELARIACAVFVGAMLVTVGKHVMPAGWLPVYPIWEEQLVMMLCAVVLMMCVRILVKSVYDKRPESKEAFFVYGTKQASQNVGLKELHGLDGKGRLVAMVRASEEEPRLSIEGAALIQPNESIADLMAATHAKTLVVPRSEYPDFFNVKHELVKELLEKGVSILLIK